MPGAVSRTTAIASASARRLAAAQARLQAAQRAGPAYSGHHTLPRTVRSGHVGRHNRPVLGLANRLVPELFLFGVGGTRSNMSFLVRAAVDFFRMTLAGDPEKASNGQVAGWSWLCSTALAADVANDVVPKSGLVEVALQLFLVLAHHIGMRSRFLLPDRSGCAAETALLCTVNNSLGSLPETQQHNFEEASPDLVVAALAVSCAMLCVAGKALAEAREAGAEVLRHAREELKEGLVDELVLLINNLVYFSGVVPDDPLIEPMKVHLDVVLTAGEDFDLLAGTRRCSAGQSSSQRSRCARRETATRPANWPLRLQTCRLRSVACQSAWCRCSQRAAESTSARIRATFKAWAHMLAFPR